MNETPSKPQELQEPIAIIGIGCMFPKAPSLQDYWSNIREGVDAISEVPPTHWSPEDYFDPDPASPDKTYGRRGGFLEPVDFDPLEFGIAPRDIEATDTSQLFGLAVAKQALEDAGYGAQGKRFERDRASVILGVTGALELVIPLGARLGHPIWRRALQDAGVDLETAEDVVRRIAASYVGWQENSFPGLLGNVVAGRIANRLDLHGTNCVVDAACASSLSAVHMAMLELESGRCDLAIAGGVDTFNDIFMHMCFSKTPALSPTGDARPFDRSSDGTILGEGLGMVVLKRLKLAVQDGDRIYAVLRGMGSSSDGKGNAVYAPSAEGQARALRAAYRRAGVQPSSIELVEAHGTGTKVGDATEIQSLMSVYQSAEANSSWCALGSVKSMIGHTKAAAGVAGLIKTALALHHKVLPPTIKVQALAEAVAAEKTPFYVNRLKRPWLPRPEHPRRAAVSAFGFGGSNFHCVVEEQVPTASASAIDWDGRVQILALSNATLEGLRAELKPWTAEGTAWKTLRELAAEARQRFQGSLPYRLLMVVERSGASASDLARLALERLEREGGTKSWSAPQGIYFGTGPAHSRLAALFPGQGAQYVGMLRDLACQFPQLQQALAEANMGFGEHGARLSDRIYPHPAFDPETLAAQEAALTATEVAQPALGAVSLGLLRVLEHFGVRLEAAVGHSYGELVALCAAGRLTSEELHRLSRLRGRLMGEGQGDRGSMLAVYADSRATAAFVREHGLDLVLANKNSSRQTVLSGITSEIERAASLLKPSGLRGQRLQVAAAFHSPLVARAVEPFGLELRKIEFRPTRFPVYANTTAEPYPEASEDARHILAQQLAEPVEFQRSIENLHTSGIQGFVELGPGHRLSGLAAEILAGKEVLTVALDGSSGKNHGMLDLARALAQLAARGYPLELSRWDEAELSTRNRTEERKKPGKKPALTVSLSGANYVAPRPKLTPRAPKESNPVSNTVSRPSIENTPMQTSKPAATPHSSPAPGDPSLLAEALRATESSLNALVRLQEQTADLHRRFLEGQVQATQSFQALVERQQAMFSSGLGLMMPSLPSTSAPLPQPGISAPLAPAQPQVIPSTPSATPAPRPTPAPARIAPPLAPTAPEQVAPSPTPPSASPKKTPAPTSTPGSQAQPQLENKAGKARVVEVLFSAVAEKTGYPAEMLELSMGLDGDLGIDSIKRVEILSALQERLPEAPVVKPEHLGKLQTLGQIAEFLAQDQGPASPARQDTGPAIQASSAAAQDPSPGRAKPEKARVVEVLFSAVAEKTGYPAEMLELSMGLDGDLGIDSIKRVEILSALQERLPEAPVVKPEHLGKLQTLGQIAEFLAREQTPTPTPQPPTEPPVAEARSTPLAEPPATAPEPGPESKLPRRLARYELRRKKLDAHRTEPTWVWPKGSLVWITRTEDGLAKALAAELTARGVEAVEIDLASSSRSMPEHLEGLLIVANRDGGESELAQRAFSLVRQAGPALLKAAERAPALLATVSRLDGSFGLGALDPKAAIGSGALAGIVKTVRHEWPALICRAIDLDRAVDQAAWAAKAILERLTSGNALECGIDRAGAWTLELEPVELSGTKGSRFNPKGVFLITGGARGVTAEAAIALASAGVSRLALIGRSPHPEPEPEPLRKLEGEVAIKRALLDWSGKKLAPRELEAEYRRVAANRETLRNIERMQRAGAQVVYRSVDLRQASAVAEAVRQFTKELGPITGVVHGAGVLADSTIEKKSDEDFSRVYSTKVLGLQTLLETLGETPLRELVLFSSSTARFGRRGQADYAAANEALNKLAQQQARRRPRCRVLSVNWGPWDGGMVTPALKELFTREGVEAIGLEEGARYLVEELSDEREARPVEVLILGAGSRLPDSMPSKNQHEKKSPGRLELPVVAERLLEVRTHPVLASHVLGGKAVLPMALMIEWLAHGVLHGNPGLRFYGFEDLRVFKGVTLGPGEAVSLQVRASQTDKQGDSIEALAELCSIGRDGVSVLHANARILIASRMPAPPAPIALPAIELEKYERSLEEVYGHLLFHGPSLRGIETVDGCGPGGIEGTALVAPQAREWMQNPLRGRWIADPLALDCAFQLMILWSLERQGMPCLPTFAGHYRQYRSAFPADGVRISARLTHREKHRALADIDWLDRSGELVARLRGYECVLDDSLFGAFQRNRLDPRGDGPA